MGSFAFTATPGKVGEGIRIILLNKQCNLPKLPILLSLVNERFKDVIAVLIIFLTNLDLIPIIDFKNNFNFLFITIIIGIFFLLLEKKNNIKKILIFFIQKIEPNKKLKLNNQHFELFRILIRPKNITISIMLGLSAWIIEGTSF